MKTPVDLGPRSTLLIDKHASFIKAFADHSCIESACKDMKTLCRWRSQEKDTFMFVATEHFRMSGVYWGVTGLRLLGKLDLLDQPSIIAWVLSCQSDGGGFGGSERHSPHILYTLSAIQILAIYDQLHQIDADQVGSCECSFINPLHTWMLEQLKVTQEAVVTIPAYVARLQQQDGSFVGDQWGEVDTRFSYCALACCSLLGKLHLVDVTKAAEYVARCRNFDGGFGVTPGNESHAGQTFTCVAALAIASSLHHVDTDLLCWWLCERQTPSGGLNGRPEKLEDVCYSWWCLSALCILERLHWIDKNALSRFILYCQDEVDGGISDRADDECDVFHTFFGIAGLSLLGHEHLEPIDPIYALPAAVVKRCLMEQAH